MVNWKKFDSKNPTFFRGRIIEGDPLLGLIRVLYHDQSEHLIYLKELIDEDGNIITSKRKVPVFNFSQTNMQQFSQKFSISKI